MHEAVLARELLVICRSDKFMWDDIAAWDASESARRAVQSKSLARALSPAAHQWFHHLGVDLTSITSINSLRIWRKYGGEGDLKYCSEILRLMVSQDSSLAMDQVFAVLGLLLAQTMTQVEVNYSVKSWEQYWVTYTQFVRAILALDDGQESVRKVVLNLARRSQGHRNLPPGVRTSIPFIRRDVTKSEITRGTI